jgi:hypothetical protein
MKVRRFNEAFDINKVRKITKVTNYWLFKPARIGEEENDYYCVRCQTQGLQDASWFVGRVNHLGLVSSVGGELPEDVKERLENEFQNYEEDPEIEI